MRRHHFLSLIAAAIALSSPQQSRAGRAVFSGDHDEVKITGDGLTKVVAGNNHYQLSGGSANFTDDCTGPQGDNQAIHNLVVSEINQDITDALGNADWTIELQIDSLGGGIRTDGIAGTNNPNGQAWGVGIRFGNGTNETTSPTGAGNFGRGADVIFGFTETALGIVTFPVLIPYVLLIGADFSLSPEGQFFNFFNAADFTDDEPETSFFQDFVGASGKLTLSRRGIDKFNRPVITIGSEADGGPGEFPSAWAWIAGNTGTPNAPVVNANFAPFGLEAVGNSPGGFGFQNINFNGLIPSESADPDGSPPIGMPVTSLFMFVENETTWVQFPGHFPVGPLPEDECYGAQPDEEQSAMFAIDFDFPVDDEGEVDARDSDGLLARIIADGGTRDDINSYGNVEVQNAIPADAGRFACLTITSEAIVEDINPDSECPITSTEVHPSQWPQYD